MNLTITTEEILRSDTSERQALAYLVEEMEPSVLAIRRTNKDSNTYNRLKETETIREFLKKL